jgi:UDP-N-acetylglucosamine 2-epimerase (non-hydrolysing)
MKVAPVHRALASRPGVNQVLVHTGQHYDVNMSDVFFQQLSIPSPDVNLGVGSGAHGKQTAEIMIGFEAHVQEHRPDVVLVYGDVNSTVAAALVCAKLEIRIGHVEAGLRSFDRTMPEEVNRLVTDQLADMLFTPSDDGDINLAKEGIPKEKIFLVGNVMIDTLVRLLPSAQSVSLDGLPQKYILVTLHRPSNVDDPASLRCLLGTLSNISTHIPVLFPVHPRTRQRIKDLGMSLPATDRLILSEPRPYIEFLALQHRSTAVVTDSGGIQEETTFLGVPCITVRENTERPITVTQGTNVLVGRDMEALSREVQNILTGKSKPHRIPPLWDGKASERIADIIAK